MSPRRHRRFTGVSHRAGSVTLVPFDQGVGIDSCLPSFNSCDALRPARARAPADDAAAGLRGARVPGARRARGRRRGRRRPCRRAAAVPRDLHLGHATSARPAARPPRCSTSCAAPSPTTSTSSATSSTAGSCSAAGTGTSRTTTSCRRCCARRARARRSSTSRATTTRRRATTSASTSAASPSATRPCTSPAPARACWSRTATASTRVVTCAKWLALLGDRLYTLILKLNQHFNALRARLGLPYWSLSQFLKLQGQERGELTSRAFEDALAREARTRGFDGVVCGHIHHAEIRADRRRPLLQCRRLGREPDGAGRSARRDAVDPALARHAAPPAPRRNAGRAIAAAAAVDCEAHEPGTRIRCRVTRHAAATRATGDMRAMRILIVSDAWSPQINGVVVTLRNTIRELEAHGPYGRDDHARRLPHDSLPDLSGDPARAPPRPPRRAAASRRSRPTRSTSRPRARWDSPRAATACARSRPFTTAYHTQFPEYVHARMPPAARHHLSLDALVPRAGERADGRHARHRAAPRGARLHQPRAVVARRGHASSSVRARTRRWTSRGRSSCTPAGSRWKRTSRRSWRSTCPAPSGSSATVPRAPSCSAAFPTRVFFGMKTGDELAWYYRQADVFVFPSRTDTFGLVMLEAMACGTPVAAYPVTGPDRRRAARRHRRPRRRPARGRARRAATCRATWSRAHALDVLLGTRHRAIRRQPAAADARG